MRAKKKKHEKSSDPQSEAKGKQNVERGIGRSAVIKILGVSQTLNN